MYKEYLGGFVYVEYDRGMLKLTIENGFEVTDIIYLEPKVYGELVSYNNSLAAKLKELNTLKEKGGD